MEYHLKTPVPEAEVRKLRVGDVIYVTGTVITARDEAHLKSLELHEAGKKPPVDFKGVAVFHCGPIMRKAGRAGRSSPRAQPPATGWRYSRTSS